MCCEKLESKKKKGKRKNNIVQTVQVVIFTIFLFSHQKKCVWKIKKIKNKKKSSCSFEIRWYQGHLEIKKKNFFLFLFFFFQTHLKKEKKVAILTTWMDRSIWIIKIKISAFLDDLNTPYTHSRHSLNIVPFDILDKAGIHICPRHHKLRSIHIVLGESWDHSDLNIRNKNDSDNSCIPLHSHCGEEQCDGSLWYRKTVLDM